MKSINSRSISYVQFRDVIVGLVLVATVFAVYWQVTTHEFINYDDPYYVTENQHVQRGLALDQILWAFTTKRSGNWHPLTWLSHMLDYQLYGMNAGMHHLTSLMFHTANSLLLFLIFRRMTGDFWPSAFVAALFALHPLHVESVAWIAERKDVLSTFFWILTIWSYIHYTEHPAFARYLAVILFFILGLMAKQMLVTLPFVLLLLDYWPLNRFQIGPSDGVATSKPNSITLRLFWEKIPFFVLAALFSAMTILVQKQGGSMTPLSALPIKARFANALVAYAGYISKMIWPTKMAVLYPYRVMLPWWHIAAASVLLLSVSYLSIKFRKSAPYFVVGWLWYLGTLVPVIGLVQIGSQSMADRYTYVTLIGLFIILAWGVPELAADRRGNKLFLTALAAVSIAALTAGTWRQVGYWKNSITLFEHTLRVTSNNHIAHNNLGNALHDKNRLAEAFGHYSEAVRIMPDYYIAHYNLGNVSIEIRRFDEAVKHYSEALRHNPDYEIAHNNLGFVLAMQGREDEAIKHYKEALRVNPHLERVHSNLGIAFIRKGNIKKAIYHFREALRIKPDDINARDNLKRALMSQKQG